MALTWSGVIPAITTPFRPDGAVDIDFLKQHARWMIDNGCTGIVALGSLGEAATMRTDEKKLILSACVDAVGSKAPVIAGISALSTAKAVELAEMAAAQGCEGLMILPPYVYAGDWREMKTHVGAVLRATPLSCMLYNNPIAYGVDFLPAQVCELLEEHYNLHAIKESSADVRRVTTLKAITNGKLRILVGVDDLILESVGAGADGWIAGLVNAMPIESVALFNHAVRNEWDQAWSLYRWFLPLLRMDTVPKFVQLIKLVQEAVGMGDRRVRPPRLELNEAETREALAIVDEARRKRRLPV